MRARFLDSSVFLHAYLKPRRPLTPREAVVKEAAKAVLERVEAEEPVITTVVHVSEVANLVESRVGLLESISLIARLISLDNVEVLSVSVSDYEEALAIAQRYAVSLNDAVAYAKMREKGIDEIYTFDKHFKNLPRIKMLPAL